MNSLSELLKEQADQCKASGEKNGSPYAEAFHVAFIVLSEIASKIAPQPAPVAGSPAKNESGGFKSICPNCGNAIEHSEAAYQPGAMLHCGSCGNEFHPARDARGDAVAQVSKSPQVGGTHYREGQAVSPWSLQKEMQSSGNAFVDARRADAIKYAFRMKGGLNLLLQDMNKARHCLTAGIEELERHIAEETAKMQDAAGKQSISPSLPKA